jgi:hypothetical protein
MIMLPHLTWVGGEILLNKLLTVSVFLLLGVIASAQCGKPVSQWFPCNYPYTRCNQLSYPVPNAAAPNPPALATAPNKIFCGYDIDGDACYVLYVAATGACVNHGLNLPDVLRRMMEFSAKADILIASCDGGLVPFKAARPDFNVEEEIHSLDAIHFKEKFVRK